MTRENYCRAGAASRTINPAPGAHLAGQLYVRKMEYVRDPLEINLLYLANQDGGVCLVSVDNSGGFEPADNAQMRALVSQETAVPADRVLICSTHTHAGGTVRALLHDSPKDTVYMALVFDQLAAAAHEAFASARPAKIGSATGTAHIGFNRRLCWEDGTHTMYGDSSRPEFTGIEGPEDAAHTILFAVDEAGKLIAICHNNCCHSTCFEIDLFASADFPGEARRLIREALGTPVPVLYLQGASGDTSPWDMTKTPSRYAPEQRLHEVGATLAAETLRLLHETTPNPNPVIHVEHSTLVMDVRLPTPAELAAAQASLEKGEVTVGRWDYVLDVCGVLKLEQEFRAAPHQIVPLWAIRIGELAIATNPFELYCQYGLDIRRRSPAQHLMIVELTNGAFGYLPTIYGILGGGYSGRAIYWTRMEPYAGYRVVDETARMLHRLFPKPGQQ
jgi:neutral ceramidase